MPLKIPPEKQKKPLNFEFGFDQMILDITPLFQTVKSFHLNFNYEKFFRQFSTKFL